MSGPDPRKVGPEMALHKRIIQFVLVTSVLQSAAWSAWMLTDGQNVGAAVCVLVGVVLGNAECWQLCRLHQITCLVLVPSFVVLMWYHRVLEEHPLVALWRCTLPLYAVLHRSLGWFGVTSVTVTMSSIIMMFLTSRDGWQETQFRMNNQDVPVGWQTAVMSVSSDASQGIMLLLSNLLGWLAFLARHDLVHSIATSVHQSRWSLQQQETGWLESEHRVGLAICLALPSAAILLRWATETQQVTTYYSSHLVLASFFFLSIMCKAPPRALKPHLEWRNVSTAEPYLANEWSEISTAVRITSICFQLSSVAYHLSAGRFYQTCVALAVLAGVCKCSKLSTMRRALSFMVYVVSPVGALIVSQTAGFTSGNPRSWPLCLGLPLVGAAVHESAWTHLSEALFTNFVMIATGGTSLCFASIAATVLSTSGLCVKLIVLKYRVDLRLMHERFSASDQGQGTGSSCSG